MLIMIEKVISRIICHAIHQEVNKYMKDYDKNKNRHILYIGM